MKSNKITKAAYSLIIICIICTGSLMCYATSTSELEGKKSQVEEKIDEANSEIQSVQRQKTAALKSIEDITAKITECENKIAELESQIQDTEIQIEDKGKKITEQEAKYKEKKKLLDDRLVAVYESGDTTYLDVLLSSSSFTDFISKYYLLESLVKCDSDLLNQIETLRKQIEQEKADLEKSKNELVSNKVEIETQKRAQQNLVAEKQLAVANLNSEEKQIQSELDSYEAEKREIQQEIAAIVAENKRKASAEAARQASIAGISGTNTSGTSGYTEPYSSNPSASGFICPLAGRSKRDITTGYYGYKGHTGVDFARNSKGAVEGLPVLAAKSGTVIISKALKSASGAYRSYGEYIVIDHGDGTLSLYAHMLAGSRKVEKGAYVSQGQAIGNVGSTGNSTGPHLHFEVRLSSGVTVNPTNYLP